MTTAAIRPEKILRELDELWVSLGKQQENGEESAGVLRACSGTLIVLAQGTRDEGEVADTLAQIMREHPSRAIVMRLVEGDSPVLEAGVRALCWKPFGSRQQICCERVEIQFSEGSVAGVTSLARSLTAPDLPITLWCKSRHMLADGGYQAVLQLAGKVIIDSAGVADLAGQLALIRGTATPGRYVADLAWTRLTRWRELVAQLFDNPAQLSRLGAIEKVTVGYEGDHVPMSAIYLAGWLRHAIGRRVEAAFDRTGESARARVQSIVFSGKDLELSVSVGQDRLMELNAGFRETHGFLPSLSEDELLREELAILGRDAIYEAVLDLAGDFLQHEHPPIQL